MVVIACLAQVLTSCTTPYPVPTYETIGVSETPKNVQAAFTKDTKHPLSAILNVQASRFQNRITGYEIRYKRKDGSDETFVIAAHQLEKDEDK
jgi:hypothetical protein